MKSTDVEHSALDPAVAVQNLTLKIVESRKALKEAERVAGEMKAAAKAARKRFKEAKKAAKEARKKTRALKRAFREASLFAMKAAAAVKKKAANAAKKRVAAGKAKAEKRKTSKKRPVRSRPRVAIQVPQEFSGINLTASSETAVSGEALQPISNVPAASPSAT